MSKCADFMEHLSAYADGELSGADKRQMEAHLMSCTNCSELLKLYREISKAEDDSTVPAPDALVGNVMERVHSDGARLGNSSKRHNRTLLMKYAPIAACLVVVLLALPFALPLLFARDDAALAPAAAPEFYTTFEAAADDDAVPAPAPDSEPAPAGAAPQNALAEPSIPEEAVSGDIVAQRDSPDHAFGEEDVDNRQRQYAVDAYGDYIYIVDGAGRRHYVLAPEPSVIDGDTQLELAPYFSTIIIAGELPDLLNDYTPIDHDIADLYFLYLIPSETARRLIDEMGARSDFTFTPIDEDGEYALVIHQP